MTVGANPAFFQIGITAIAASTSAAAGSLTAGGDTALVTNAAAATAWVSFNGTAAAGAGYPVMAGAQRAIAISPFVSSASVVLQTGTGEVYIEVGRGAAH